MSQQQQQQPSSQPRMKPTAVVYWVRVLVAVVAGFANEYLGVNSSAFGEFAMIAGIGLGVVFYMISVFIVKYGLHYSETQLKGKNKYITLGGGTFIVVWVTVAVLLNTMRAA